MRRAKRADANQPQIVSILRRAGVKVCVLSDVGRGVPDLLTYHGGVLRLIEVKDCNKPPCERRLTDEEQAFASVWPVVVVTNEREALAAHGFHLEIAE